MWMAVAPDLRTDIVVVLGSACLRIEHRAFVSISKAENTLSTFLKEFLITELAS